MKRFSLSMLGLSVMLGGAFLSDFVVQGDSGLEWQEKSSSFESLTWVNAISYCNGLNLIEINNINDNGEGWRLPNYNELYSLIDVTKRTHMTSLLSDTNNTYWTSTSFKGDFDNQAWVIDFSTGKDGIVEKTDNISVRCVRDLTVSSGS